jgi:hypothetical protein
MTFGSTIVVLFIFIIAGLLVIRPFMVSTQDQKSGGSGLYDSLLAEKERLYASIEDLDLDLELSKISPEEHAQGREELLIQAAKVLERLDAHPYSSQKKQAPSVQSEGDELDKMIAERRRQIKSSQEKVCSQCNLPVGEGDQFCSHCGGKL